VLLEDLASADPYLQRAAWPSTEPRGSPIILGIVSKIWGGVAVLALIATAGLAAAAALVPDKTPGAATIAAAAIFVVALAGYARERRDQQTEQAKRAEEVNLLRRAVYREIRDHHYSLFRFMDSVMPAMLLRKHGDFVERDQSHLGQLTTRSLEAVTNQTLGREEFEHVPCTSTMSLASTVPEIAKMQTS
jgi:hypothetical protein